MNKPKRTLTELHKQHISEGVTLNSLKRKAKRIIKKTKLKKKTGGKDNEECSKSCN